MNLDREGGSFLDLYEHTLPDETQGKRQVNGRGLQRVDGVKEERSKVAHLRRGGYIHASPDIANHTGRQVHTPAKQEETRCQVLGVS